MRASFEVFLGSTNSLGGFEVLGGSAFVVDGGGSGVDSLGVDFAGLERVRAIMKYVDTNWYDIFP